MLQVQDLHVLLPSPRSEPSNYFLTHFLLLLGMVPYYIFTLKYNPVWLWALTIVLHVASTICLIILAFIDPGIVKKQTEVFEYSDTKDIPLNPNIINGSMRVQDTMYCFPIKSHHLKLKSCRTCLVFRAPRMVHCPQCNVCV